MQRLGPRARLEATGRFGMRLGLDRIRAALSELGHPEQQFPSLLVGGTNGKGSTVAMSEALLRAAGLRVGATISPHLSALRERFRIDGRCVDDAAIDAALDRVFAVCREGLTHFELLTAAAFLLFAEAGVDAAVVEVGLGGEHDASATCEPLVVALTSIGLDHTEQLGPDIASIVRTKARALPPGRVMVLGDARADRVAVVEQIVAERAGTLLRADRDFEAEGDDTAFVYRSPSRRAGPLVLGLSGAHQVKNAATAIAAVDAFAEVADLPRVADRDLAAALPAVRFPGRLERWRGKPFGPGFVLDGAHNGEGAEALARELLRSRPRRRLLVFAALADKDRAAILRVLLPHVDEVIVTEGTSSPRFDAKETLLVLVRTLAALPARALPLEDALLYALAEPADTEVVVTGSLYLLGEVRPRLGLPIE